MKSQYLKIMIPKESLENDAFKQDPTEIRRVLCEVADKIAKGETSGVCLDINGNNVGNWSLPWQLL